MGESEDRNRWKRQFINRTLGINTYCIVLYCIDGVVIAVQFTATFFKIYCAPPNLDFTWT